MFIVDIIFHLKRIATEKNVLLQVKGLIQIMVKFRAKKILCTLPSPTKHPFKGHKISCTKTIM